MALSKNRIKYIHSLEQKKEPEGRQGISGRRA